MEQNIIILNIINKKYDYRDAYVEYIGVENLITNELITELNKKTININEIINTLIEQDRCMLILSFCERIKIIEQYLIDKILNYLMDNNYYTSIIHFCNIVINVPYTKIENYILSTNNLKIILEYAIGIMNEKSKNKIINYIIKNGEEKELICLLKNLNQPPYEKIFKKLKKIENGLNIIFNLAIEYFDSRCQSYAINEILNSNNESLIKKLYNNIDMHTDQYLIKKIELKIEEIEKKYIPKTPSNLSNIIIIELNEEFLNYLSNLASREKIIYLQQCLKDLNKLIVAKVCDEEYLEILNKYYKFKIINDTNLYSILLGTTKIRKETKILHSNHFFTKSSLQRGVKKKYERTGGYTLQSTVGWFFGEPCASEPIMKFEPYILKSRNELYAFFEEKKYEALITYYAVEDFKYPDVSIILDKEGLKISEIERLIKKKKIIVTNVEPGTFVNQFYLERKYDNSNNLNNFRKVIFDTSIPIIYANSIIPLIKKQLTKEKIESDINFIIDYLKKKNEFEYRFMIDNHLHTDNEYINKVFKKSVK